jgi:hypothetical protein
LPRRRRKFLTQPWANQRVKLYLSGVKLPKLFSSADIVFRDYLNKEAAKDIALNKLIAQTAMIHADGKKEFVDVITASWNDYVHMAYWLGNRTEAKTQEMRDEYELWKNVKPKVKLDKDGKLVVHGIPKTF